MTRKWSIVLLLIAFSLPLLGGCTKAPEPEKVQMKGNYTQDKDAPPSKTNAGANGAQQAL